MRGKAYVVLLWGVMLASPFLLSADVWTQTDWSGGDGYFQWQDPTGYYVGSGVNGWRVPGNLLLFAPDFDHFVSIGNPGSAFGIYALNSDDSNHFYAGTGDIASDTAAVFISRDYGATWDTTAMLPGITYAVHSIFITELGYIFAGTDPARIYRTHSSGDSLWETVHTINNSQGNYVSDFSEVDFNLYATTVRPTINLARVYKSENNGNYWSDSVFPQPEIGGITPAAIFELVLSEDSSFFIATNYTTIGARIFRFPSYGTGWELCANLPDTTRKPFALDIGYDTLGNYGSMYVGMGSDSAMVFRSDDQGNTWLSCGSLETARQVKGIVVDKDGAVYAACQTMRGLNDKVKVFRSIDMGSIWDTSSTIGNDSINKPTAFHQTNKGFLLLGTERTGEVFKAAYTDSGSMESSVYDVGTGNGSTEWGVIWWVQALNNQIVRIKVRTDVDSTMNNSVPWHLCPEAALGQDISSLASVTDGHRYIQYRAEFKTSDIDTSPALKEINIEFVIDSAAPRIDTAFASDGDTAVPGIDADDYVIIVFDDSTNAPPIPPDGINAILALNNGHSWWDGNGFVYAQWLSADSLRISWPGLQGSPTVSGGDTIYPDTVTIVDRWGNASYVPAVLTGSFDPPGVEESKEIRPQGEKILIFPSVAHHHLNACVELDKDSYVNIGIFDISGRFVCTLFEKELTKGRHTLRIPAKDQNAGIYFIKTRIDNTFTIEKIVIIR